MASPDSGLCHPGHAPDDWQLVPGVSFGPKRDYLYAGDRLALQLDWTVEGPVRRYIAVDHLNSTRVVVTDDDGVVTAEAVDYLPFGGFLTGDPVPDTTHLFTGHERDTAQLASNLDYMHARYFSPNLGRFLSVDPVADVKRAIARPQMWNKYTYALNNPVSNVDRDGRETGSVTNSAEWGLQPGGPLPLKQEAAMWAAVALVGAASYAAVGGGAALLPFATSAALSPQGQRLAQAGLELANPNPGALPSQAITANPKIYAQLEKQLQRDGAGSILKALRSSQAILKQRQEKLPALENKSAVEKTIRNVQRQIETLKQFIRDHELEGH
jgi:RHS repeat-associated protein